MNSQDIVAWKCFIILAGRGGIGKTLIAMLLTVALLLRNRTPAIVEADLQKRLHLLFPDLVTTIDIDQLDALAEDPLALARAFSYEDIGNIAGKDKSTVSRQISKSPDSEMSGPDQVTRHG